MEGLWVDGVFKGARKIFHLISGTGVTISASDSPDAGDNELEITINATGSGGGVDSIAKEGSAQLTGDVTLSEGSNVTLTQAGNDIEIAATGAAGAPSTVDYLVGTADAGLSNEIVVGATPGGELGGTWASPTVDATHSGSTHAATQAAAEATAAAANTADIATHAGLADPHTGYRLESADHSHATTGLQAGNIAATAVTVDSTNLDGVATNVQTVFEELETQVQSAASTHAGAADPHTGYRLESADHSHATTGLQAGNIAATAVTVDSTNLDGTATNVQTVFEELETQVQSAASTHAAAADPHTGYRLESADHTHASTGLQAGTIDHGAITGLTDDDHTQYLKESDVDAVIFTIGAFFETATTLTTGVRPIWRAPFSCTVTQVRGYVDTGNTTVINAGSGATSAADFCSSNITIDPSDAWEAGTVNQNSSLSAGDTVSVEIVTAGTATQLTIQIELTRDLSP